MDSVIFILVVKLRIMVEGIIFLFLLFSFFFIVSEVSKVSRSDGDEVKDSS